MKKVFTAIYFLTMACIVQAQWESVSINGLASTSGISRVSVFGNEIWVGTTGQVFRSPDAGATWENLSSGIQANISNVTGIVRLGNRTYVSFGGNGKHYVHSRESGDSTWSLDTAGWPAYTVMGNVRLFARQLITHKNEYVVGVLESNYVIYRKASDMAWTTMTVPATHRTPAGIFSSGDTLYLVNPDSLAYSTDLGANWSTRSLTPQLPGIMSRIFKNQSTSRIYAGASGFATPSTDALFYSDDNGVSWDSLPFKSQTIGRIADLIADGNEIHVSVEATLTQGDTLKKVMRSTDGGQNWTDITENMYSLIRFKFHSAGSLAMLNGTLYAAINFSSGLLKYSSGGSPTGIADATKMLQTKVYPNPASSVVTFELDDVVNVLVSDLKGQTTKLPVYGRSVDVSALPAGLYLMQIESRGGVYFAKWMKQ